MKKPSPEEKAHKKEEKYTQSKKVEVVSRVNRPKDFPVGRDHLHFEAGEKKTLDRGITEHPDFIQQSGDFLVKEQ